MKGRGSPVFNNIGGKIKTLTKVLCWIGIIFSVISGIAMMTSGVDRVTINGSYAIVSPVIIGIVVIIFGCLVSWISAFFAYGFGQLIENTDEIRRNTGRQ